MSIEEKIREGMFGVCVWDPSNPQKSKPYIVRTETANRDAIYTSEKYAKWYAGLRNKNWLSKMRKMRKAGKPIFGESDYFVMNAKGERVM